MPFPGFVDLQNSEKPSSNPDQLVCADIILQAHELSLHTIAVFR